jgi:hypothetical protein
LNSTIAQQQRAIEQLATQMQKGSVTAKQNEIETEQHQ